MASALRHENLAAQGDTLECTNPLMGQNLDQTDATELDMLGRAPRKAHNVSSHSPRRQTPSPHCVRLMEVVPTENRNPSRRSTASLEYSKKPLGWGDAVPGSRLTSVDDVSGNGLSPSNWGTESISPESDRLSVVDHSSPVDKPNQDGRLSNGDLSWVMPLRIFSSKKSKSIGLETNRLPKGIRAYYERQDDLITAYEAMATDSKLNVHCQRDEDDGVLASRLSQISFLVNLALMIAKAMAVDMSNSLSIISSLVDSIVDLISGIIIWWTSHAIRTTNLYVYPVGRSRLEPVAIIILSVIMSLASFEVMISSVRKMLSLGRDMDGIAVFELPTLLIAGSTVVVKFILALSFCLIMKKKKTSSPAVDALIQDHRNDTMSNLVAILCGYLGSVQFANRVNTKQVAYIDPAGAIVIALYIIISWWRTGTAQLKMITGYTADPGFLSQITWIALNHSPKILKIDTVRAFHFGSKFLVEVDIVLEAATVLSESHDIGERLQQKLEKLPRVERAFVHVDYEYDHRPQDEHQVT